MNNEIEIGCEIMHVITKEGGIAYGVSKNLNGNIQYELKPNTMDKEGNPKKSKWLDSGVVKRVSDGIIGGVDIAKETKTDIGLGVTVKHFNGFEGITTERVRYFNGCVYFGVMPKVEESNKMPDLQYIPCQYLTIKVEENAVKTESSPNGGPSSKAPLM